MKRKNQTREMRIKTNPLADLQKQAQDLLQTNFAPPARYGTAFHVLPPSTDLRQLPVEDFKPARPRWASSPLLREFQFDAADSYLQWHLAHLKNVGLEFIHVRPGKHKRLLISAGEVRTSQLFCCVVSSGSSLIVEDSISDREIALRRVLILQHANSTVDWWSLRAHNQFLNEKFTVWLQGDDAAIDLRHLVAAGHHDQADITVTVYHQALRTRSDVRSRLAVSDQATAIYHAHLDVAKLAHQTDGYEQARGLHLSPTAVIDVLPELTIRTNDVRCSHGVSATYLDESALFYAQARGIPYHHAAQLATRGFFYDQLAVPSGMDQSLSAALKRLWPTPSSYA